MKDITTLQGLNLQSETSIITVKINETESVKELLKLIQNFHPLFLKSFKFQQDQLLLESKLPSLWKEIAYTLIDLSIDKITYEDAKEYIVNEVIKYRVASMSTLTLLNSAFKKGYEVTPTLVMDRMLGYTKTLNRHYTLGCGKGSQIMYSISSSQDSKIAKEIQRDKWASNQIIEKLALPIPKWQVLESEDDIEKTWDLYQKPLVIKPTGLTGGKGVSMNIKTIDQAKKAYRWAKEKTDEKIRPLWQKKIMMQEQVQGEDYRLLVIDGKLEIVTKRIPAFIIGDGKKNIEQLIEETNNDPRRDISNPAHTLKPIRIDEPLLEFLKEQNLSLQYIPKKDEKVTVRKVASMSQGGITEDYTDKVGPEIKYIVESIAKSIHAFVIGADILCNDISKPLTKENGGILEINTMPEAYLNLFPVIGESREYVGDIYIEKLLKENKTKRIVTIGQFTKDIPTLLRQKSILGSYLTDEEYIGEFKDGDILFNSLKVNSGVDKQKAIEALKINASLDAILIHHRDWQDVRENGLGFDRIDLVIVSKQQSTQKENFKIIRKYQRKGLIDKIKII
jgi:D-alanine-D-alanine ligase-like ATP-grasp enzyme